ncbi:methylisocitrate lyase [uncultured archaeon]|nr:methylisocitrate lyase [uncultured archaeon]
MRRLISKGAVVAPGAYNGVSALIAQQAGFEALYMSGSGVAGNMGLPDLSMTTLTEVVEDARRIVSVSRLPLIVDADTGFGETMNVVRTTRMMEDAGVAAIHLEDQVLPKRCGHLSGKKVVPLDEMVKKIRAAVSARRNENFMIIARTDARAVEGVKEAIERSKEYVEAGADAIFTEALESRDEFREFARELDVPLLANMTEFGKSPLLSVDELEEIGYRIVIFPLTGFRVSLKAVKDSYIQLKRDGTQNNFLDRLMTRKDYYDLIGYNEYEKEDNEIFNYKGVKK